MISLKAEDGKGIDLRKVQDTVRNAGFIPDALDVIGIGQVFTRDSVVGITFGGDLFFELAAGRRTAQILQAEAAQFFLITGRVVSSNTDHLELLRVDHFSLR